MHNTHTIDKLLDTTGLFCPEPVMMLHSTFKDIKAGDVVKVLATDPSTKRDIPKFCLFLGHELIQQVDDGAQYQYVIRKGG
ncbi:sulfurtransferase TusA [Oceanospirillaceae bacterium]|jgi:tRNA 2-thiouridine synthesizing protein A|uniref:sulfurtransferase TusA n=1 Tax=Candidatus Njordibacter sp. Uisw_002 TaxID=3230971 RepID=UPI002370A4EE|nr:sulfurtransferase TusA [Oceanospirillaceae bacterium]MDC1341113.1 sulfurtransferase TusA [Oceanospirillaceae bacterium]MDC1509312.1 sulfurtransferase TusA [Oceanospirillaceae bacterium]|tara:strand:- start:1884 stop:2126 length:243 start_codon:yes stop_codon:yes gene_type:complete